MPFCPMCKTEYVEGIQQCHECDVVLVAELPVEEIIDVEECPACAGDVETGGEYCPHCGALLTDDEIKCANHPDVEAEGVCIICRTALCPACIHANSGRVLCEEHKKVEISEDWAVAFQSMDYYEANLVKGKLENAGITLAPRNNMGIGFVADGFIETAIGRTILRYPVKIFVPVDQYLEAVQIVNEPPAESNDEL